MWRLVPLVLMLGASSAHAQMTESEQAVWRLEESYYRMAEANDLEGFRSLFHPDAVGWPAPDAVPHGSERVGWWIPLVHQNPAELWRYELDRQAIQEFGDGDVVVVHYLLRDYFVSAGTGGEIRSDLFRVSHTWMRDGDTWRIVSGMGARAAQP